MGNLICIPEAKQRKKTSDVAEATGISKSTLTALYYERANTIEMSLETLIQFAVKTWRLT